MRDPGLSVYRVAERRPTVFASSLQFESRRSGKPHQVEPMAKAKMKGTESGWRSEPDAPLRDLAKLRSAVDTSARVLVSLTYQLLLGIVTAYYTKEPRMDRYTKVVLTIIAVALSFDAVERIVTPAHAATALTRVAICDPDNPNLCAGVFTGKWDPGRHGMGVFQQQ
jgi:hypothetical protein